MILSYKSTKTIIEKWNGLRSEKYDTVVKIIETEPLWIIWIMDGSKIWWDTNLLLKKKVCTPGQKKRTPWIKCRMRVNSGSNGIRPVSFTHGLAGTGWPFDPRQSLGRISASRSSWCRRTSQHERTFARGRCCIAPASSPRTQSPPGECLPATE